MWSQVIPLTFKEISEGTPDIEIHFTSGDRHYLLDIYPFDGPTGYFAHAYTPGTEKTGKHCEVRYTSINMPSSARVYILQLN